MRILGYTMAETLASGTDLIDGLGATLGVDMGSWWTPDDAFFGVLRDKQIIRDYAEGNGNRDKAEGWIPRFMRFPTRLYRQQVS
jgi:ParB family transcriptional regulator, chromosome partitioning protein